MLNPGWVLHLLTAGYKTTTALVVLYDVVALTANISATELSSVHDDPDNTEPVSLTIMSLTILTLTILTIRAETCHITHVSC